MTETPTPQTDAAVHEAGMYRPERLVVSVEHSRLLERSLIATQKERDAWKSMAELQQALALRGEPVAEYVATLEKAITAMADDGWLYYGPEGMSEPQELCHAALVAINNRPLYAAPISGEPVAKEKIREIARKTAEEAFHNRGSLPTIYDFEKAIRAGIALYAAPISVERVREACAKDTERLDAIADNCWKLDPFDRPTGGGDADVGWRVSSYFMQSPTERVVAEADDDDPRVAIDAALALPLAAQPEGK